MDAWSYSLGREAEILQDTQSASDKIFGGQRHGDRTIEKSDFQHRTFNNVSFPRTRIKDTNSLIACYLDVICDAQKLTDALLLAAASSTVTSLTLRCMVLTCVREIR